MNKILQILLIFIISNKATFSQNQTTDSIYDYWAKRGIVESTFAYMQDFELKKNLNTNEILGLKKYERKYISKIDSALYFNLDSIVFFLKKNSWKITSDSIFLKLTEKYKKRNVLNKTFFENSIDSSYINWHYKTTEIIKSYDDVILNSNSQKKSNLLNASNNNELNNIKSNSENNNPFWVSYFIYACFILIGFIGGIFFVHNKIKNIVKEILEVEYTTYNHDSNNKYFFNFLNVIDVLKNKKNHYKIKEEKLQTKIEKLEKQIKDFKSDKLNTGNDLIKKEFSVEKDVNKALNNENEDLEEQKEDGNSYVFDLNPKSKNILKLFFTIPQQDGSFKLINSDKNNDGKKYYKIEYQEDSQEGSLHFIPSDKDIKAIGLLEQFLEPVCDINNVISADNASKIEMIKNGKVFLENDKWVIDPNNKVKIRLI